MWTQQGEVSFGGIAIGSMSFEVWFDALLVMLFELG